MEFLLAIRPIDLAILGTLGALWAGGALFIYVLYRWILRYERAHGDDRPPGIATRAAVPQVKEATRARPPAASDTPAGSDPALPVHA